MSAPIVSLATEAAKAGQYPQQFNKREAKLLESVQSYVDGISDLQSHLIKFAGTFTTVGGDASEAITVTGAAATDIVMVTVKTAGATPRSIVAATAATNAINVTLSGDPSNDHVLQYMVIRANS